MALFLHLSDLHLGELNDHQMVGDDKDHILKPSDRLSRISKMENALSELGKKLARDKTPLDGMIISGDITLAGSEKGFEKLKDFLSHLGPALPEPSKIVVVPGNHDVAWFTDPGSSDRYAHFLKHIRGAGFVTPMLDGIDGHILKGDVGEMARHALVDPSYRWAVIPVNSANYCGCLASADVSEEQWKDWAATIDGGGAGAAEKAFRAVRLRDMPRISPWQFTRLRELVQHLNTVAIKEGHSAGIRTIATVHHHLLPVTDDEETKAYESFANLGLLRAFLGSNKIDIVLHGHKHTPHIYRDFVTPFDDSGSPHSVLVVSGGTVGMGAVSNEACRLVDLHLQHQQAPNVDVIGVPGVANGLSLPDLTARKRQFGLWQGAPDAFPTRYFPLSIVGQTVSQTYERIQTLLAGRSLSDRLSVVCCIEDASDAGRIPPSFPATSGIGSPQEWLDRMVAWWQRSPPGGSGDALHFTHGERIYSYAGSINQVDSAIRALQGPKTDGRAVITLLDPRAEQDKLASRWPSFCLVQFVIRRSQGNIWLDALAFFRHQEMRYWWVVNIAEIAELRRVVFEGIKRTYPGLKVGSITTTTAMAHLADAPPFVAVPELDRLVDMDENELWSMVYGLVWAEMPRRALLNEKWKAMLVDLIPTAGADPQRAPVAVRGLYYVHTTLRQFASHHSTDAFRAFTTEIERLLSANHEHAKIVSEATEDDHRKWRDSVNRYVERALVALNSLLPEAEGISV